MFLKLKGESWTRKQLSCVFWDMVAVKRATGSLDMGKRKVVVRRDVSFNETDFGHQKQAVDIEGTADVDAESAVEDCGNQEPHRCLRATRGKPPIRLGFDEHADLTAITHSIVALRAAIHELSMSQVHFKRLWIASILCSCMHACSGKMLQILSTSH